MRRILAILLLSAIATFCVACAKQDESSSAPNVNSSTNAAKSYPDQSAPTTTSAPPGSGMGNRGNSNSVRIKPPTEK